MWYYEKNQDIKIFLSCLSLSYKIKIIEYLIK